MGRLPGARDGLPECADAKGQRRGRRAAVKGTAANVFAGLVVRGHCEPPRIPRSLVVFAILRDVCCWMGLSAITRRACSNSLDSRELRLYFRLQPKSTPHDSASLVKWQDCRDTLFNGCPDRSVSKKPSYSDRGACFSISARTAHFQRYIATGT
jgi:hypothetical protein